MADRVLSLRAHLDLTQEKLASLAGLDRLEVLAIEKGKNKATSYAARLALARAVDVPLEAMAAYIDGEISLAGLMSVKGTYNAYQWWRAVVETAEHPKSDCPPTPVAGSRILPKG